MSRYFVDDPPVAIADPVGTSNTIWIKARMDVATRDKVRTELIQLSETGVVLPSFGDETALLIHNIVRWEGPDLDTMPCDREHIRTLDVRDPHLEVVLAEIGERNKRRVAPDPKATGGSGSPSAG